MFFIPGIVITILTFPGVIVHELAHQLFCRWLKVPVFDVCYFRSENPAGYVIHEIPKNKYHSILISIGPFIINTLIAFLIAFPASLQFKFDDASFVDYILMYLAISIAMHAFPSTGDAQSLWASTVTNTEAPILLKIIAVPIVGLIYLGAFGSVFWLDLAFGFAVALGLPSLLLKLFC